MKAFIILVLFLLVFLLLANKSMAGVDLTPSTDASGQVYVPEVFATLPPQQVITILGTPPPSQISAPILVTGGCSEPYTVRSGDTLSQIAVNCGTSLAVLTQVNPQMNNVDCIYPGQQINIRSANMVHPPAFCKAAAAVRAAPVPVVALPVDCACYNDSIPVSGPGPRLIAGSQVQVTASNFPANTPVNVAIGPQASGYQLVTSGVTDANGSLTTQITVPNSPDAQTAWVVMVSTTTPIPLLVMSQLFTIGP
jgi:LysM repeat protein